jgi:hypothetical protein
MPVLGVERVRMDGGFKCFVIPYNNNNNQAF